MKQFVFYIGYICIVPKYTCMSDLPQGFVYLDRIDPTIVQTVMYYGNRNFVGERITGYKSPKIILTGEAAFGLRNVQEGIRNDNYSLVVYDGYRPTKAVEHFIRWSNDSGESKMKDFFHPYISRKDIFELGYLAVKSAHCRGSTVDVSIIQLGKEVDADPKLIKRQLKDGRSIYYWQDNTVDMYSSVDLIDVVSWPNSTLIEEEYQNRRNYLHSKMESHHFRQSLLEWWHFTLIDEPFRGTYFNFDIE